MRSLSLAIAALALIATPAFAAPCRNAHGKFVKCPTKTTTTTKKAPCRDAKGHFKKC